MLAPVSSHVHQGHQELRYVIIHNLLFVHVQNVHEFDIFKAITIGKFWVN